MTPMFSSAWLELALAGLVTALVANRRLSSIQGAELCGPALAGGRAGEVGRATLLRATCEASDSSWARLVRAVLREASPYVVSTKEEGGYRDAAQRTGSETVTRLVASEVARMRRDRAIGLSGVAAALLGSAMLIPAQSVAMGLLAIAALASGWRVMVNARRAMAAFDEATRALPELVATLPPPPPPITLASEPAPAKVSVRTSGGVLGGFFIYGIGGICVLLMAAVFSEMRQLVPASQIGLLFGVHVMLLPLVLMLSVLMPKIHAALDVSAGEVVLVHRILGVVYARTIAPLEIVGSFYVDFTGRRSNTALAIEVERGGKHRDRPHHRRPTPDERIMLTSGDAAAEAAAVLNKALGRMGWIREPER